MSVDSLKSVTLRASKLRLPVNSGHYELMLGDLHERFNSWHADGSLLEKLAGAASQSGGTASG